MNKNIAAACTKKEHNRVADNKNLHRASKAKQDEFYTQLADIEFELKHYKDHFKDKIVFCNCDDPYESNFFKYFAMNFNQLGLKKLIATCYDNSPITYTQFSLLGEDKTIQNRNRHPYKIEIAAVDDYNGDGAVDLADVRYLLQNKNNTLMLLKGNGDFRSDECVELLKQADIVVTNPPFSLFREYLAQLIKFNKSFVIIGNQNAITYKEVFPLISQNRLWLGYNNGAHKFQVPDTYNRDNVVIENGVRYAKFGNICWFTNLVIAKRNEGLVLYKKYNSNEYPTYFNFNAINIDKVSDIPYDYDGFMGVPITFLDKYNPEQFKIIGLGISNSGLEIGVKPYTEEHGKYRKEQQNKAAVNGDLYMLDEFGHPIVPYARIIIKRRNTNED